MALLRLGVLCAVLDDNQRVLLSQRSDLNFWGLPGGRLDAGEHMAEAAEREVLEETGLVIHLERPICLYFLRGWQRLNVLYSGWVLGGILLSHTDETRCNKFFALSDMPRMNWPFLVQHVFSEPDLRTYVVEMEPQEFRCIRWRLRGRWLWNLLRGRPEPRFPKFQVRTVGLVWNQTHQRILVLDSLGKTILPTVECDGHSAPWDALSNVVYRQSGHRLTFRWVGLYEDVARNRIDLIFAATADEEVELPVGVEWLVARTAPLSQLEVDMISRVKSTYHHDSVWSIRHGDTLGHHRTIVLEGK
jgi:8-oxo-dGTP pyrophosphatase MutT (NUDIX family)